MNQEEHNNTKMVILLSESQEATSLIVHKNTAARILKNVQAGAGFTVECEAEFERISVNFVSFAPGEVRSAFVAENSPNENGMVLS